MESHHVLKLLSLKLIAVAISTTIALRVVENEKRKKAFQKADMNRLRSDTIKDLVNNGGVSLNELANIFGTDVDSVEKKYSHTNT